MSYGEDALLHRAAFLDQLLVLVFLLRSAAGLATLWGTFPLTLFHPGVLALARMFLHRVVLLNNRYVVTSYIRLVKDRGIGLTLHHAYSSNC